MLRDRQGRLYERVGHEIRRLRELPTGPTGGVADSGPSQRGEPRIDDFGEAGGPRQASYQKLLPDPGEKRVVRWGDFKSMLSSQVALPERLRDAHRIPCYVQVFELQRGQRVEALATAILGEPEAAGELEPLSEALAGKLGLTRLLGRRAREFHPIWRERGVLLPFERVVRLQVAHDPTREMAEEISGGPTLSPDGPAGAFTTEPLGGRRAIPKRYAKPWEFRRTREDVLYDMHAEARRRGFLRALLQRLKATVGRGARARKWRALIRGKTPEKILWLVRPPKGGLSDPEIREWVGEVLRQAGYDSRTMLTEWEVFWRRKGCES